jgi:hypothetical protein
MQQLALFPEVEPEWTSDDWQTPNEIASLMAKLVKPSDRFILEPAAGKGQIAKYLPFGTFCVEINEQRFVSGYKNTLHCHWLNSNFFDEYYLCHVGYDLIISNPPFSKCVEFVERSLCLLNPDNPESRILFLLPLDWNCSKERGNAWRKLNAHIHHIHQIMGRVAYLDASGVPQTKRQCVDAVFEIRPGKGGVVSYLEESCNY